MTQASSGERGFTLLELLVVLTIIALVSAVVLPLAGGANENRTFQAEIREVAARLRLARLQAISSGAETIVTVDLEKKSVSAGGHIVNLPPDTLLQVLTARGLIVPGVASIRFMPRGGSTGGTITIARRTIAVTIEISWLTGAVSLRMGVPL